MTIEESSSIMPQKIIGEMANISIYETTDRGSAFSALSPPLGAMVRNLESSFISDNEKESRAVAKFVNLSKIYLRALQTYDAGKDEWMAVFQQFKRLLEDNSRILRKNA